MGQAGTSVRETPRSTRKNPKEQPAATTPEPVLGGKTKVIKMRADKLRVHPKVHRDLVPSRLKQLVRFMDLDAIGCMHAVEYSINGHHGVWVIDGQHRLAALMQHGFGEWEVDVKIYIDVDSDERAADLFLKLDDYSPVTTYDKFVNEVRAGNEDACGVQTTLRRFGLQASRGVGDGKLRCVVILKRVWRMNAGETLGRTLLVITSAWGTPSAAFDGAIIDGLATVLFVYPEVDNRRMIKKLAKY